MKWLLHKNYKYLLAVVICFTGMISCNKVEYTGTDPYAGAKAPLSIAIKKNFISPESGSTGTVVTLSGQDFAKYRDSEMVVKFNGIPGEIVKAGDSLLRVKVPEMASSGLITLTVLHQVFAGPFFTVKGPIDIDPDFHAMPGADGTINCIQFVPGGKYIIGGSFNDYGNSGLVDGYHGIARINPDGSLDKSFKIGKGIQGTVNTIVVQADGRYIAGGNFNNYDERFQPGAISNIIRLNTDGSIDSMIVHNASGNTDTLPSLNAYFDGPVTKILQMPYSGDLIVIGNYNYFMQKDFSIATADGLRDSVRIDSIKMEGITRLNTDGSFDSSFNYNKAAGTSYPGTNGPVYDALVLATGKIILAGNFTKYHDKTANKIVRLNKDATIDPSFNAGAGPDDRVFSVTLMPDGKYLIAGQFNSVGGKERRKLAVLNTDGTLNNSFTVGSGPNAGPDGIIMQTEVLNNNKILATGLFDKFSGIARNGTVILNRDGTVSKSFNNLGAMEPAGMVMDILNIPNKNATILVGGFTEFNLQPVSRIVSLKY